MSRLGLTYLLSIAALGAAQAACTSRSSDALPGAVAGTAGAQAAAGGSGMGGAAGASQANAGGGSVAMTDTDACRAGIAADCERLALCQGRDLTTCLQFESLCPDYYFNADSKRRAADVTGCLGALSARTCTDVGLGLYPACWVFGERAAGAGCAYASQCESGSCGNGTQCAKCGSGGAALGSACVPGSCTAGSYCHPKTKVCTEGASISYAAQGEHCDLAASPVVGCAGDLLCAASASGGSGGTCMPAPAAGQPCVANGSGPPTTCAVGSSCTSPAGGTCLQNGPCGVDLHCDSESYCTDSNGGVACAPRATTGQACSELGSAALPPCVAPDVCVSSSARCVTPRSAGQACGADTPCAQLLSCLAGTCQPLGSANCPL